MVCMSVWSWIYRHALGYVQGCQFSGIGVFSPCLFFVYGFMLLLLEKAMYKMCVSLYIFVWNEGLRMQHQGEPHTPSILNKDLQTKQYGNNKIREYKTYPCIPNLHHTSSSMSPYLTKYFVSNILPYFIGTC